MSRGLGDVYKRQDYKDMKTVEIAAAVEQQIQETINKNLTKEKVEEKC